MARPDQQPGQPLPWVEQFKAEHSLERIGNETVRRQFGKFLLDRAASRAYYEIYTDEQFTQGIGNGDSPRTELIHQIGHSTLRYNALTTGVISNYSYAEAYPGGHTLLDTADKDFLMSQFDGSTYALYHMLANEPDSLSREIQLPYGRKTTGGELIEDMMRHETGHAFKNAAFGDHFEIPRPLEMKNAWG